jgi:MFS family permease
MVESIGGHDEFAGKLVIVLSLCNVAGRILMGMLADRMNKVTLLSRASLAMAVGLLMSAVFASEDDYAQPCLVLTVVLVAAAYGGAWVVIVGILTDWFGNDDFGKNYGLIAMGPALSGMAFNTMSAWFYQHNIIDDGDAHTVCLGAACYRGTYILTGVAAIVSVIVLRYLEYRRR